MVRTISLTSVSVKRVVIDVAGQKVIVLFDILDETGRVWDSQEATFFIDMPAADPVPDAWFEIPAGYVPTLVAIVNDAKAAIEARYLV